MNINRRSFYEFWRKILNIIHRREIPKSIKYTIYETTSISKEKSELLPKEAVIVPCSISG